LSTIARVPGTDSQVRGKLNWTKAV